MKKIKSFEEFKDKVTTDPELQEKLKKDPVGTMQEFSVSAPVYTSDRFVYRVVVSGLIGVLFLGVIYFIYQYQVSLNLRRDYADHVLDVISKLNGNDMLADDKLVSLKDAVGQTTALNGTTPDGIIAVFTAIIGVLAGLFAPSPFSNKGNQ
ncbi:MAG: Nif11-like leader peptide family natural product precursor [Bacteroidota bacterium]|nr:Nif11-like leader peptide family natural product precursor [Bacteroidota bacterium]